MSNYSAAVKIEKWRFDIVSKLYKSQSPEKQKALFYYAGALSKAGMYAKADAIYKQLLKATDEEPILSKANIEGERRSNEIRAKGKY